MEIKFLKYYKNIPPLFCLAACMDQRVKDYESKYGSASSSTTTSFTFGNDPFFMQLAKGKQQVGSSSNDLLKYLDTNYLSYLSHDEIKNFDIMKWWKSHESTFPMLSKMARDLLISSVSIVTSKSAFSVTINMIGDRRTSLTPEMLEALTCLKDWEKVKHVKSSSISGVRLVLLSPIIFVAIEKAYSDATIDTGGVSRSRVILDSTGNVDS